MKIVFLSVLFRHPLGECKVGGGEISNRKLLEVLAERYEVFVISAIGHKMWKESINGVVYYDLSSSSKFVWVPGVLKKYLSKILFRWMAPVLMRDISPDIILCATQEYDVASRYSRIKRVPIGAFVRAFENFSSYSDTTLKQRSKRVLKRIIYGDTHSTGINKMDFLLPNSDFMDRLCAKNFSVRSRYTIYPPVTLPKCKDIRLKSNAVRCVRSILMVSGAKKKGRDVFVRLAEHMPEIEFLILGHVASDPEDEVYPGNLKVLPWVKQPEELIAKADLVLVPSIWEEPFGRISVEALQCGTPVLVSNIGGLPETVGYQDDLLVRPGDELAWQKKVSACLDYPDWFLDANTQAMQDAERYSLSSQAETLEKALLVEVDRIGAMRAER